MNTKLAWKSKELWLSVGVILNSVLNIYGLPSIPMTPEVVGAVGVLFFALRRWFTDSQLVWSKGQ